MTNQEIIEQELGLLEYPAYQKLVLRGFHIDTICTDCNVIDLLLPGKFKPVGHAWYTVPKHFSQYNLDSCIELCADTYHIDSLSHENLQPVIKYLKLYYYKIIKYSCDK